MSYVHAFFARFVLALVPALLLATPATAQETAPITLPGMGTPTAASQAQPTPSVSSYRINPGDELEIYVWGEERLQRAMSVLPDGTIAFPLVGQLKVSGMLPQQVEQMVSDRLSSQYRGEVPFVTVTVKEPAGMQFSVMGKVRAPGSFNVGRYINVLDALSLAGGPAEFANLANVLVITRREGQMVTATVRLDALFRSGARTDDVQRANLVQIMPGDVIIVP